MAPDIGDDRRLDHAINSPGEASSIDAVAGQVPCLNLSWQFFDEVSDRICSGRPNDVVSEQEVFRESVSLQAVHETTNVAKTSHHFAEPSEYSASISKSRSSTSLYDSAPGTPFWSSSVLFDGRKVPLMRR